MTTTAGNIGLLETCVVKNIRSNRKGQNCHRVTSLAYSRNALRLSKLQVIYGDADRRLNRRERNGTWEAKNWKELFAPTSPELKDRIVRGEIVLCEPDK